MASTINSSGADSDSIKGSVLPWQQATVAKLVQLKQRGRLPHAILIDLHTAVDSRAFGWFLIQALACQRADTSGQPCGECQHCQLMRANSYPDFTFTTLQENERTSRLNRDIKIEQIRRLIHQLSLTSTLSAGKFALVYPAERMNASSANSLLKTLEEPSSDATLVLLTHNAGRLPITIRSRCQRWQLARPEPDYAKRWLSENGMPGDRITDYLELARMDVQYALQLYRQDTGQHLVEFQKSLKAYLSDRCSVLAVIQGVKSIAEDELQLIIRHVLLSLLYKQLERQLDEGTKQRIIGLLELMKQAGFILLSKENNLILQLQLEDVLISLKQILNREMNHARSSQPGNSVT